MASKKIILDIQNLVGGIAGEQILNGVNLRILEGEIHAIMGRNGSGKSTLSKIIAGHPSYQVKSGTILYKDNEIIGLEPEERAKKGIFLGFQYPIEVSGVKNIDFLKASVNSRRKDKGESELDTFEFEEYIEEKLKIIQIEKNFLERGVNEGFSGGEKKRNEILQMALLDPILSILDETDSGLDIDSLRIVAEGIKRLHSNKKGTVLITHYQRLLNEIQPDFVHIMEQGKIVRTGNKDLAIELENKGYEMIENIGI